MIAWSVTDEIFFSYSLSAMKICYFDCFLYVHLSSLVFAQFFFQIQKNGDIQTLKGCSFWLWKNDFCRINNKRVRTIQSKITFSYTPCILSLYWNCHKCHRRVVSCQFYRLVTTCQQVSRNLSISSSCDKSVKIRLVATCWNNLQQACG